MAPAFQSLREDAAGRTLRAVLAIAMLVGCDNTPPHDFAGVLGPLDDVVVCSIYPSERFASIQVGDTHALDVGLPAEPDVWGRAGASLTYAPDGSLVCAYPVGLSAVRVQWGGETIGEPGCDDCSTRYRPLFLEALYFPELERACSACDASDCVPFEGAAADRYYLWCDSPEDVAP